MAITIQIFEHTGATPNNEVVTNVNWKNQSVKDSLYKYYYYPTRRPEGTDIAKHSVTKYIYAKISGTYASAKRVRWVVTGAPMSVGERMYMATRNTYVTPTDTFDGSLTHINSGALHVYPNLSTVGPTSATSRVPELSTNTTYYTDYLVTQLFIDNQTAYVGNSDILEFKLVLDEYE